MVWQSPSCLAKSLLLLCLPAATQAVAIQQSAADEIPRQQPTAAAAMRTEDVTQNLGPFSIAGEKFTVILYAKRLPEAPNRKQMQTLSALEIRDHADAVLYKRAFAYQIAAGKFATTLTASAKLLPATNGNVCSLPTAKSLPIRKAPPTGKSSASSRASSVSFRVRRVLRFRERRE